MTEKKYVEVDKLLKDLCMVSAPTPSESWIVEKCIDKVNEQSAADVASIVRCKDCTHYEPYRKPVEDFDGRCLAKGHETDEMEFCSYGTKMDEKGDTE